MCIRDSPDPVKLVTAMLGISQSSLEEAEAALVAAFGDIDLRSQDLPFTHTRYYEREMGARTVRRIVSFANLVDPGELAAIKLTTNAIEASLALEGRRRVNLDPGYLTAAKLVLATTKNNAHRIYLGQGIYAEVTLAYHDGAYRPWPWTYPDYAEGTYNEILLRIRQRCLAQLRAMRG
mgnify:CR=1 FL=1